MFSLYYISWIISWDFFCAVTLFLGMIPWFVQGAHAKP